MKAGDILNTLALYTYTNERSLEDQIFLLAGLKKKFRKGQTYTALDLQVMLDREIQTLKTIKAKK